MPAWFLPSLVAAIVSAVYFQLHHQRNNPKILPTIEQQQQQQQRNALYVVGDLHGDAHCARHWVEQTGLMKDGRWTDDSSQLVFLGDYIDKGPTSRQTVEFVKSLTDKFPEHVAALLGNHELELLRDRDAEGNEWRWGGGGFFQLAYASAHPGEYLNFVNETTEEDEIVVEALYAASLEVYGMNHHQSVFLSPDSNSKGGGRSILQYVPPELRSLVKERMAVFQESYLDSFRSGTELGTWLEERPVLIQKKDILFVHGGISQDSAQYIAKWGVDGINKLFAAHAHEEKLSDFLDRTHEGQAVYDMVTFRGNHEPAACSYLSSVLPEGISRLGVGHTPGYDVRLACNGNFLALDSSLGRWYRNSGNNYCDGINEQSSSNGRFRCERMNPTCEGQIVRIEEDGNVYLIE